MSAEPLKDFQSVVIEVHEWVGGTGGCMEVWGWGAFASLLVVEYTYVHTYLSPIVAHTHTHTYIHVVTKPICYT